jgi:hypothetical protein
MLNHMIRAEKQELQEYVNRYEHSVPDPWPHPSYTGGGRRRGDVAVELDDGDSSTSTSSVGIGEGGVETKPPNRNPLGAYSTTYHCIKGTQRKRQKSPVLLHLNESQYVISPLARRVTTLRGTASRGGSPTARRACPPRTATRGRTGPKPRTRR